MQPAAYDNDLSSILEALTDGVLKIDGRGVVVFLNGAAERILRMQRREILGYSFRDLEVPFPVDRSGPHDFRHENGAWMRAELKPLPHDAQILQIRDITSEVEAETALHTSHEFVRAVLDNIDAGIVACDEKGTLRLFNHATREFHGIEEEAIAPDDWPSRYSLYSADGSTLLRKEEIPLYRAFAGEVVKNVEMVIAPANGRCRNVLASGRALIGRDGRKLGAVVAMQDITHRKRSSARLRTALRQFRRLFNDGPIAYCEIDRDGLIRRVNRVECRLMGYVRGDMVGKPAWEFVVESDRESFRHQLLERLSGQHPMTVIEREFVTCGGKHLLLELHEELMYNSAGQVAGLRTAKLDVTERKRRELAEAESADIRSILERIGDAYIAFDTEWRYTYVNGKAAELALKPAEELLGRCVWEEFPESVHTAFYSELQRAMREQIPIEFENYFAPLGKLFENTVYPSPGGVGVFYRDISERKRTQLTLEKKSAELARKNAELELFTSVASHDLQEPLRMIGGYAGLLTRRYAAGLDEDANDYLRYIARGVEQMERLIKDLLALSRLDEVVEAPVARVDVAEVVEFICGNLSLPLEDTDGLVERHNLPVVQFHETQLIQVMQNLIGNAIKYRSASAPRIKICGARVAGAWQISVADNGIGFEMKYADQVFRPFKRLQRGNDGGTGIGLAICKKIVETRGGSISVESCPGVGSTFTFTIPDALPSSE